MPFFEGNKMTAGYGNGPDIISSCSINVDRGEIVAILKLHEYHVDRRTPLGAGAFGSVYLATDKRMNRR